MRSSVRIQVDTEGLDPRSVLSRRGDITGILIARRDRMTTGASLRLEAMLGPFRAKRRDSKTWRHSTSAGCADRSGPQCAQATTECYTT